MPLNANIDGQIGTDNYESKENEYLMEEQARHVYKKVESSNLININMLKQEKEQDQELGKLDNTSEDIKPYRELILNNAEKIETVLSQMEQWSILSNVVNYIKYDRHPKNFHNLNISVVHKEKYKRKSNLEEEDRHVLKLDFGDTLEKLKGKYSDVYRGIQS